MALISAGEWIDRYGEDAERRSAQDDRDDHDGSAQALTWRVEVDVPRLESRARHWRRASHAPRLYGSFRPNAMRPPRRCARRRR